MKVAKGILVDDVKRLRADLGGGSKNAFLLCCVPPWGSWRPWLVLGRNTATSTALRRFLTAESCVEQETGRYKRIERESRYPVFFCWK